MSKTPPNFEDSVFINCPFDAEYELLFEAIVFTVQYSGFIPRCSKEADNAGLVRLHKIQDIIAECMYAVHDISRTEVDGPFKLPRFNMPLELGLDLGAKRYGSTLHKRKSLLILDRSKYRFKRFISDIGGQDIASHNRSAKQVIKRVRDWISTESGRRTIPGGEHMFRKYLSFRRSFPDLRDRLDYDRKDLTFRDFTQIVQVWLQENDI